MTAVPTLSWIAPQRVGAGQGRLTCLLSMNGSTVEPDAAMADVPSDPSTPPLTVGIVFVRNLLSGVRAKGLSCDAWLTEAGIPLQHLSDDSAHVSLHQYGELLRVLMVRLEDETLGFLARKSKPGSVMMQARSALGARTLDVAIRRVAHVFGLIHDDVSLHLVRAGELAGFGLRFHDDVVRANPHVHELLLRAYWRLFAWLVGGQLPPVRFDFGFARPPYSDAFGPIFPAPWRFDAEYSAVWFEAERLQMPVCRDEAALAAFSKEGPIHIVLPRRDHGVGGRVRSHLQRTQPQWPDLERTARALSMSVATLQRHLASEGTSFQTIKDQLRCEIAIYRLHTSNIALVKLAAELGFADSSSFQHAFKSWTGCPPGRYRKVRG